MKVPDVENFSTFLQRENENVKKRYEVIENPEDGDIYIHRAYLEITSATVDIVGRYLCAFNETLEFQEDVEYDELLIDHKATNFYIFVNGEDFFLVIRNSI